ncbi:MAG: hypothetical protein KF684_10520 [Phycisphaeraceae bacterium]|nr:hypothetical protein [Phycisphaeraceae bacterium]
MHDEPSRAPHPEHGSIRGTITAMLIAFVCVLVFRAFVVEAFIIPTGSMAPTLLGRHARLHSPQTGATWTIGAAPRAGAAMRADADDPYTALRTIDDDAPVRSGDRIFVFKPLSFFRDPDRWSVVVFKNPENPDENYIKRLVGLPGEQVWLVDGDVFTRAGDHEEWRIARKPDRVQRTLWRTLYSTEHAPLDAGDPSLRWRSPWLLTLDDNSRIDTSGRTVRVDTPARATLRWDNALRAVDDANPYNDSPSLRGLPVFRTGDARFRAGVRPDDDSLAVSIVLGARAHEFLVDIAPGALRLSMRRAEGEGASERWTVLDERPFPGLRAGRWHDLQLSHADQRVEVSLDGRAVLRHELDWSPLDRLRFATGMTETRLAQVLADANSRALAEPATYRHAEARVRASFEGSAFTLSRVGLDRDVSFQPAYREAGRFSGEMAFASHPMRPARLNDLQMLVLGDNSAASRDGRLWDTVDTRVAAQIDPTIGVVPRSLVSGRAFMVYFPAPHALRIAGERKPLVPDAGRVRFIR